jgi:hypothetical protein
MQPYPNFVRRLIISEQMRRVSLFFPCSVSAFSLLCLASPFHLSLGSFSFFAQLLSFDRFSKS